jgi:hypothetical protein
MHGHRGLQPQVQLIWAAVIWNDIPSRRPLIGRIVAHTACECIPRRIDCFKEDVACQQPRSHVGKDPTEMAYKADEGTLQRLPNTTNNPKHFLPLKTTAMSTMPWNPFSVCGIPHSGPGSCCGMTKKGEPCKNSIKVEDTKIGHQKLTTLAREPFNLSTLRSKLYDIARDFLCARWHR